MKPPLSEGACGSLEQVLEALVKGIHIPPERSFGWKLFPGSIAVNQLNARSRGPSVAR